MPTRLATPRRHRVRRACWRWAGRALGLLLLLLALAFLIVFRAALYDRFWRFPRQAKAIAALRAECRTPTLDDGWNEYRGVLHAHSELSHDSAVTQAEAIRALHAADVDFIGMTDHYADGSADYARGWNGVVDGILFLRGFELHHGLMPWGVPAGTVFHADDEPRAVARRARELGAVLFFSHCEQTRLWDLPELDGMEIYNLHADFQDEAGQNLWPRILLCLGAYPDQTVRSIFDAPRPLLARWDALNRQRPITGIGANDAHQNVGYRAVVSPRGTLIFSGTGEKTEVLREVRLNAVTRPVARWLVGPLEPGREVWRWELDPYERSCRFVNTHVLARACTEPDILEALRVGRAFVAFSLLADARGFTCLAVGAQRSAVMGESIPWEEGLRLRAAAPLPGRFRVVRDGTPMVESQGRELDVPADGPGSYRVEVELRVVDEWVPWIYANPVRVGLAAPQP